MVESRIDRDIQSVLRVVKAHGKVTRTRLRAALSSRFWKTGGAGVLEGVIRRGLLVETRPGGQGDPHVYSTPRRAGLSPQQLRPLVLDILERKLVATRSHVCKRLRAGNTSWEEAAAALDVLVKAGDVRKMRGYVDPESLRANLTTLYCLPAREKEALEAHGRQGARKRRLLQILRKAGETGLLSSALRSQGYGSTVNELEEEGVVLSVGGRRMDGTLPYVILAPASEAPPAPPEPAAPGDPVLDALDSGPQEFQVVFGKAGRQILATHAQELVARGEMGRDVIVGPDGRQSVVFFRIRPDTPKCDRCGDHTAAERVEGGFAISLAIPGSDVEQLRFGHLCGMCRLQFGELAKLTRAHVQATLRTFDPRQ